MPNTNNTQAKLVEISDASSFLAHLTVHTEQRAEVTRPTTAQRPLDRALNTAWIRRVSLALDAQRKAGAVLSYAWSLPRVETLSRSHAWANLKLAIETSVGRVEGSLYVDAEGHGYGTASLALSGSTGALLCTSLFEKAWFPGELGKSKTRGGHTGAELLGERRDVEIRYARVKGSNASINLTDDETRELIIALWGQAPELRKAIKQQGEVSRLIDSEVARLPSSEAQFRSQTLDLLSWNIKIVRHILADAKGGYAFRRCDLEDCWDALEDLASAMQAADIVFDPAARDMEIAAIIDEQISAGEMQ